MRERTQQVQRSLLAWYDKNARALPWRVSPAKRRSGGRADPYRVWLSEVMLQQTTVAAVTPYFIAFTTRWPTVGALAAAQDAEVMAAWAGLGYYARARNLLACARFITQTCNGKFPQDEKPLLALPGVGPYTAAAIAAIAFEQPAVVVDGNVERVMARYFAVLTPLPEAKPKLRDLAKALSPTSRSGDYAQAVMDLGATVCTPTSPSCGICPWHQTCQAYLQGLAAELPKRTRKKPRPTRLGIAYITQRPDGALLLERRPDKGLLGGMLGWPGSDWGDAPADLPPIRAKWTTVPGEVVHVFTHFNLRLTVKTARSDETPTRGHFVPRAEFTVTDLPSLMQKVYKAACDAGCVI